VFNFRNLRSWTASAPRRRDGFTLIEVAVAAAIVAMLAAVTAPYMVSFLDKQRAQATADKLAALGMGIAAFGSAVNTNGAQTGTTYPGLISELTSQIPFNNTAGHNSCGSAGLGTFNATATAAWSNNGPFVNFYVPQGGLRTPLGLVADSLVRTPGSPVAGTLGIRMVGLDTADATTLDLIIDGGDGGAVGTLRIGNVRGGHADVVYLVPVGPRC
jgi:prepilin-type N-terminal cleavage/methylation domain-containing protein